MCALLICVFPAHMHNKSHQGIRQNQYGDIGQTKRIRRRGKKMDQNHSSDSIFLLAVCAGNRFSEPPRRSHSYLACFGSRSLLHHRLCNKLRLLTVENPDDLSSVQCLHFYVKKVITKTKRRPWKSTNQRTKLYY